MKLNLSQFQGYEELKVFLKVFKSTKELCAGLVLHMPRVLAASPDEPPSGHSCLKPSPSARGRETATLSPTQGAGFHSAVSLVHISALLTKQGMSFFPGHGVTLKPKQNKTKM